MTPPKAETENCLPVGTRLADFEITGILGEGGFGIVYVAFDHSLQRTVAIKEYIPSSLAGRGADGSITVRSQRHKETFDAGLRSFINEARLLAQFDHPSLVKVYRFWEENKTAYMAMRYYEGHTLKNIIKDNPKIVTEAWLRFIFKQILEALDALYKIKILHRDVSPDNIIIQKNGSAVLLDFGAARQIIGDMTQGLTVILKPGYAPIEQYADDSAMKQGPWTDIYSLSAVMYLAVVKAPPPSSVARMVSDPIKPLHDGTHPGFSAKFLAAIDKGMAVQPEDRPQSIAEFRKLLSIGTFVSDGPGKSSSAPGDSSNRRSLTNVASTRQKKEPEKDASALAVIIEQPGKTSTIKRPVLLVAGVLFLAAIGAILYTNKTPSNDLNANASPTSLATQRTETGTPAADPQSPEQVSDIETIAWNALSNNQNVTAEELTAFIQKYPSGKHIEQANIKLAQMKPEASPTIEIQTTTSLPAVAEVPAEPVVEKIAVKLAVKPWGTVFVNGKQKAISPPAKKIILTEGKYKIRVVNPNFPDYVSEIEVSKKRPISIEHDFSLSSK